jgi:glycosyltransferase involved in cell wall biosynthesis
MKGKILYIGGFEMPDKNAAAQRVLANAKLFRELGYETTFLGISKSERINKKYYTQQNDVCGFKNYVINYPSNILKWCKYASYIKHITSYFSEVNIIIAYNYPAIALYRLSCWCRNHNKKIVADCTEWYQSAWSIMGCIKGIDTFLRMRFIHSQLSGLIAISKYLYDYYNCRMHNVLQLPPLVDKSDAKWVSKDCNRGKPKDGVINIVYAGNPGIGFKDNLSLIFNALAYVKQKGFVLNLTIIGITEAQYVTNQIEQIPHNIKDNITFLGRIEHIEAITFIRKADYQLIFRNNTRVNRAGFPMKFVETISCGTAVICNEFSNIKDFMVANMNGYIISDISADIMSEELEDIFERKEYPCVDRDIFDYHNFLSISNHFLTQF